jgi:hypothetical protein
VSSGAGHDDGFGGGPPPGQGEPQPEAYPARLDGRLDEGLSRGMWLIKWLLALPHVVILVFLWIAFFFVSLIAFFAILFTGRYPRGLFEFNVGVLRWSWRVAFYAYVIATDRYPPFSLEDDPGYPARLQIDYPERLSRGLVLVKWWLLAIPQYFVLAVLAGGAAYAGSSGMDGGDNYVRSGGLIDVLIVIAAVALLFTTRYPDGLFRLVMGLHRWILRVVAYAALFRDEYPPFRLDQGGGDPGTIAPPVPPPEDRNPASW